MTNTELKASLETAIQAWADAQCERDGWPEMWWPEGLTERITDAAFAVLMANKEACQFTKEQERDRG